jgi:hypothetical protein
MIELTHKIKNFAENYPGEISTKKDTKRFVS